MAAPSRATTTAETQKASSIAAQVRGEMARTTMRMVAQQPVFGIGLGEFYQRSGEFSSPELLALFYQRSTRTHTIIFCRFSRKRG